MLEMPKSKTIKYPTVFHGIFFDDEWEFDAPSIVYSPIKRYGIGGNSGEIDSMVEDYCIDLCLGENPRRGWSKFDLKEFKWRGWSPRGFSRRKKAWHITIRVKWYKNEDGDLTFSMKRTERWGLPNARK